MEEGKDLIFSCTAYVNVQKDKQKGLQPHAEKCIFIEYESGYKSWKFYYLETKKMSISNTAIFDKLSFPAKHKLNSFLPSGALLNTKPLLITQDKPDHEGDNDDNLPPPAPYLPFAPPCVPLLASPTSPLVSVKILTLRLIFLLIYQLYLSHYLLNLLYILLLLSLIIYVMASSVLHLISTLSLITLLVLANSLASGGRSLSPSLLILHLQFQRPWWQS